MASMLTLWIVIVAIAYILAFIQIYGCYHFKSIQSLLIIQKRYPQLVLIESYVVIVYLTISVPFWTNSNYKATNFGLSPSQYSIFEVITAHWMVTPVYHFILIIELSRLWLVSYNLHYLHSSKNQQWKSQIDHTFTQKK
eukprot:241823_1